MDKQGKLSLADKNKVIENLTKRQQGRTAAPCEMCGTNQWFVADHLLNATIVVPGMGLTVGGPSYPQVQVICGNCGHTRLLNAYAIGLLDPDKPVTADDSGTS
ncbi:MAG TPA: hypothetical protein VKI44_17845 [Acetobacteraceae bacterium]|nr:hypothetical protein [Acetobacteraceae bacterium]